jgi:TonB family protein
MKTVCIAIVLLVQFAVSYSQINGAKGELENPGSLSAFTFHQQENPADITSSQQLRSLTEEPTVLSRTEPQYPLSAIRDSAVGTVMVRLSIDERGNVKSAAAIKPVREDLAKSAVEAALKWKFSPARANGNPIESEVVLPIKFALVSFPAKFVTNPLTIDDIQSAFELLGLNVDRFSYEAPVRHELSLHYEVYRNGKLVDKIRGGSMGQAAGRIGVTLYTQQTDSTVRFTTKTVRGKSSGSTSSAPIRTKGLIAKMYVQPEKFTLVEGAENPYFIFVADSQSVSGNGIAEDVRQLALKYDLVVALYFGMKRLK